MRRLFVVGLALVAALAGAPPVHAAPRFAQSDPIYSYSAAIREAVWVDTPLDNDGNGVPDKVAVDIVRPSEPAQTGGRVPVIMDASPYYQCCGRGNESETKVYANGVVTKFPLYYDNYFVPRGYAFLAVDLAGTSRSTGCEDVGGPEEVLGAKAVIDWLNGTATAHDAAGATVVASWATGKVGMIGKSWDGSVANGVAATGVKGLATIVPISAISSWYDYERINGAVNPRTSSMTGLHGLVTSRPSGTCAAVTNALSSGSDAATANYNSFWDARNYVAKANQVKASVFVVHGMNDLNVQGVNYGQWWDALAANNVPRKIWLSQEGHVDPFDFRRQAWVDTLHRWFDYWLLGLDSGVMSEPMASVERGADVWADSTTWPPAGTVDNVYSLAAGTPGTLSLAAPVAGTSTISDSPNASESTTVGSPTQNKNGRKVYWTAPLAAPLHLAGTPTVTLRVRSTKATTILSARLVDYGTATRVNYRASGEGITTLASESCWGPATAADDACYKNTAKTVATADLAVLSRGWIDGAHRDSLSSPTNMAAGTWYTVTWKLRPLDQVLPAGHRLGLVLSLSDQEFVSPKSTGATVDVDLARSLLRLPTAPNALEGRVALEPSVTVEAPDGPSVVGFR
ncbi:X-Pro dipeptidyl-peptidase [Longispora fulva]|uniref:X-Pro dipeptidyl-peptidase n=1 Tax=Longispora fulva TaxID=619741 RepID=A0A8J7GWK1_9ACTN|nr:Xaa-Pro dipeptidyl-peptidase [Longispora fulva]MBG6139438.1 X-Pro dipeptidyl-peptidase [Longispora fulva]GIG58937.1 X-Pro dipeptidyl-peptidase [Longispora fulva]